MCLEIELCYNLIKSKLKEKESADKIVSRKDNWFIIDFFFLLFFFTPTTTESLNSVLLEVYLN